jgi:uncharacterized protein YbaA (DUF1428 family)
VYIAGFVIPVPEEKMDAYGKWAENGAAIFKEYGCIEIVESWEDNVPPASTPISAARSPQKRARRLSSTWQVWPDKATLDSAEATMQEDERFEIFG